MRATGLLLALVPLVACGGGAASTPDPVTPGASGPTFAIELDGDVPVGTRWRETVRLSSRSEQQLVVQGQPQGAVESFAGELVATVRLVRTTPDGLQAELECTIESLTITEGPQSELAPGTVVQVVRGDAQPIRIDGEPVEAPLAELLGKLLSDGPDRDEDAVFGTDEAQPVGGTWPIDRARAVQELGRGGLEMDPERVSGEVTLLERVEAPVEALRLRASFHAEGFAMAGLPPGATIQQATVDASMTSLWPQQGLRLEREEESTTEMHVELLIETQQEGSGTLTIDMRQERSLTREPL